MTAAVCGSTSIRDRTVTVPRLNGPATAGVTTSIPNGAPSYGPVRYTRPGSSYGSLPSPALASELPIRLSAPHCSCAAWGSGQGVTEARIAATPGGRCTLKACSRWSPSGSPKVRLKDVNAPACGLADPAFTVGVNGNGSAQRWPSAPLVI